MLKKYNIGFDIWGLILFLTIMLPTFIWLAIPAPHDVLRAASVTGVVDAIASICQVVMVFALCIFLNKNCKKINFSSLVLATIVCCLLYFVSWVLYYMGVVNPVIILGLTIPPCFAFLFFAMDRKNYIALVPTIIFTMCHFIYAIVNYII